MELAEWMADASLPQLTLKPAQDVNVNKKIFYKYISNEGEAKGNMNLLLNGVGNLMKDTENAVVLDTFFVCIFTGKSAFKPPLSLCLVAEFRGHRHYSSQRKTELGIA